MAGSLCAIACTDLELEREMGKINVFYVSCCSS